jgi:hypothetical protein
MPDFLLCYIEQFLTVLPAQDLDDNGYSQYNVTGVFANGSTIANGEYKVFLRALHVTGNPGVLNDYETWLSPEFIIKAD